MRVRQSLRGRGPGEQAHRRIAHQEAGLPSLPAAASVGRVLFPLFSEGDWRWAERRCFLRLSLVPQSLRGRWPGEQAHRRIAHQEAGLPPLPAVASVGRLPFPLFSKRVRRWAERAGCFFLSFRSGTGGGGAPGVFPLFRTVGLGARDGQSWPSQARLSGLTP